MDINNSTRNVFEKNYMQNFIQMCIEQKLLTYSIYTILTY